MAIKTIRFAKMNEDLHDLAKIKGIQDKKVVGECYNSAMKWYSIKMKNKPLDTTIPNISNVGYISKRVANIDYDTYREFKISCIKLDINVSEGINLAISEWLEL